MAVTEDDINGFASFAIRKVHDGTDVPLLEDMLEMWRLECRPSEEAKQDALAIKAAVRDFANGDRGTPVEDVISELRQRHDNQPS